MQLDYQHSISSSCAITYHLAHNPAAQAKLQKELDDALGSEDDPVATFEQVKRLPYLEAVINEALRIHSTSAMGLARLVPEGGLTVLGKTFPQGTVVSVPTYTIHRDKGAWGDDSEDFRPERWFERDEETIQKAFNPFSFGPRYALPLPHTKWNDPYLFQSMRRTEFGFHGITFDNFIFIEAIPFCP